MLTAKVLKEYFKVFMVKWWDPPCIQSFCHMSLLVTCRYPGAWTDSETSRYIITGGWFVLLKLTSKKNDIIRISERPKVMAIKGNRLERTSISLDGLVS
jgi:hypothetical protein